MAAIFMFLRYGVAIGNKSDVREMAMLNKASEHQNITSHIKSKNYSKNQTMTDLNKPSILSN